MAEISIIIPMYNAELYIKQCIDSIVNQTMTDLEILCIDGASTDDTLKIVNKYAKRDSRIKIYSKPNEGVSLGRNYGLDRAQGKYIMFVDADDWIDADTCDYIYFKAEEQQADVVTWSYVREFKDNALPKDIFKENERVFVEEDIKMLHRRFIGLVGEELGQVETADALCPVWCKLYRRDILENNKIRFKDIREIGTYEDGLFNLEVFEYLQKVVYVQKYFYHYRKYNESSITSQYKERLFDQWNHLYDLMESYIKNKKLGQEYEMALNNRICLGILGQGLNLMAGDYKNKRKRISQMLSNSRYRKAYRKFELKYFPIHWKVFYGFAKYNISFGVYIMLICIRRMIGR